MRRLFVLMLIITAIAAGLWWTGRVPLAAVQALGAVTFLVAIGAVISYLPQRGRRAMSFVYAFILLSAVAGGLGYFQFMFKPQMIKDIISKSPQPVASVAVVTASSQEWAPQIPAIGSFRALLGIDVAPQIGGVIRAIRFESGQDVAKGDVLVELDDNVEQADLKSNLATLKNADLSLDRQRQLISGGSTARSTLDAAQSQRDTAAAAVDRSRALIAQKQLLAPFSGRVGLRKIDTGQYVSPGTSIVTLQQVDPILVDFPVPEQNLAVVSIGQSVDINVDAWPDRKTRAVIKSIDARVNPETRNVLVRAEAPNKDKVLRPGMFANIDLTIGAQRKVVVLPRTTITYSLVGDSVFVVKPAPAQPPQGQAQASPQPAEESFVVERRAVKIGETRGDLVGVLDGVADGDKIVSEGQVKLLPGQRVRIDNSAPLPPPVVPRPKQ